MADGALLPLGKQQFPDSDGNPLAGGRVFFYVPNTTTFKDTWQEETLSVLNSNPVELDAAGEAVIFGVGDYRQVVLDVFGNTIWDQFVSSPLSNGGAIGELILEAETVGEVIDILKATLPEALEGTRDDRLMTPYLSMKQKWESPGTELNFVGFFGGVADENEDNTPAFERMYEYYDDIGNQIYFSDYAAYGLPQGLSLQAMPQVHFPAGIFVYNGAQFVPSGPNFRGFRLTGDAEDGTSIVIASDVEFIQFPPTTPYKSGVSFEDLTFVGGRRVFANRATLDVPQMWTRSIRCRYLNQTRGALASLWRDDPYWDIRDNFFWGSLETNPTIALTIPRIAAAMNVSGNTFQGFAYGIKVLGGVGGFQANWNINDNYFWALETSGFHKADVWIVPGGPSDFEFGRAIGFRRNRFSNENSAGRCKFLIADQDTGTGADALDWSQLDAPSSGYVRGLILTENVVDMTGTARATPNNAPAIFSWTARLTGLNIQGNYTSSWARAWIGFGAGVAVPYEDIQGDIIIENNAGSSFGPSWPRVDFSNISFPFGIAKANFRGNELGDPGQFYGASSPSAQQYGYALMDAVQGDAFTLVGAVTVVTVNDETGAANGGEYTFGGLDPNFVHIAVIMTVAGLVAGDEVCVEWYAQPGATVSMDKFECSITAVFTASAPAGYAVNEVCTLSTMAGGWMRRRMKFVVTSPLDTLIFRIFPTFVTLATKCKLQIGNFRAYKAQRWIDWP